MKILLTWFELAFFQNKSLQNKGGRFTTYNILYYTTRTVYQDEQGYMTTLWINIKFNTNRYKILVIKVIGDYCDL